MDWTNLSKESGGIKTHVKENEKELIQTFFRKLLQQSQTNRKE